MRKKIIATGIAIGLLLIGSLGIFQVLRFFEHKRVIREQQRAAFERKQLEIELMKGFEEAISPAAKSFVEETRLAYSALKDSLNQAKEQCRESLKNKVEEIDSYSSRTLKSDQEIKVDYLAFINVNYFEPLDDALKEFSRTHSSETNLLCTKLLLHDVQGLEAPKFEVQQKLFAWAADETGQALRSKEAATWKTAEDLATFIPILGDGWDLYRSAVKDPRLENLQVKADNIANRLFNQVESRLEEKVGKELLTELQVEALCRKSADAHVMFDKYMMTLKAENEIP